MTSLRLVVVICAALGLVASAAAPASPTAWRIVASANDSSDFYASASITKKVTNGRAARVRVSASARVTVRGNVLCVRNSDFSFEDRSFARRLRYGSASLPLPLTRAECTYIIDGTLANGGTVRIKLAILF